MSGRGQRKVPISLFSFQDIITSVMGVIIMITLFLAVELVNRKENAPPRKTNEITNKIDDAVANTEADIKAMREELKHYQEKLQQIVNLNKPELDRQVQDIKRLTSDLGNELGKTEQELQEAKQRKDVAEAAQSQGKEDSKNIETLLRETAEMENKLREMKQANQRYFLPARGASKIPWLIEIRDRNILVAQAGKRAPPQQIQNVAQIRQFASQRDRNTEYFVIFLDQSSVDTFRQVRQILQQLQFDVGYDLLASNQTVINPQTGAVPP
jgi:hypothetical protein